MQKSEIQVLIETALDYGLKYVPGQIASLIKTAVEAVLPQLIDSLVGSSTVEQIVNSVFAAASIALAGHPVAVWALNAVVKKVILAEIQKLLAASKQSVPVMHCNEVQIGFLPCVE